jgi:3-oxoacyl-[acyl-carrier protein] reductase
VTELTGKVALVTGASKGIGAGIATAFGAAAAKVAVGYARDKEGAERIVSEIEPLCLPWGMHRAAPSIRHPRRR